jgi:hypothetical protein
MDAFQKSIG